MHTAMSLMAAFKFLQAAKVACCAQPPELFDMPAPCLCCNTDAAVGRLEARPTCCVLRPDLPKASPNVACLPRADSGAVGGREPALPCPADAGREDDGPGTPMSSSSSMAAVPLGCGREGSEGPLGSMQAANAVVACADCIM